MSEIQKEYSLDIRTGIQTITNTKETIMKQTPAFKSIIEDYVYTGIGESMIGGLKPEDVLNDEKLIVEYADYLLDFCESIAPGCGDNGDRMRYYAQARSLKAFLNKILNKDSKS